MGIKVEPTLNADLVLVDETDPEPIRGERLHSTCGWTPFEGMQGVFPDLTMVRGTVVYHDGEFGPAVGVNVRSSPSGGRQ
jgi:dihydroorotase